MDSNSNRILVCLDDKGNFILILERFLNYFTDKLNVNKFTEINGVVILQGFTLSDKESDMVVIDVDNGIPPPHPPPPPGRIVVVRLGNMSNLNNPRSSLYNSLFQRITDATHYLLVVLGEYFNGIPPNENQLSEQAKNIYGIIEKFIKNKNGDKNGGKKSYSSTIRKSPSSRRGRRSAKKCCTKHKPKRRQRRASRRMYYSIPL